MSDSKTYISTEQAYQDASAEVNRLRKGTRLKREVAKGIFNCLDFGPIVTRGAAERLGITNIERGTEGKLTKRIKVTTKDAGTHWYTITVKEDR